MLKLVKLDYTFPGSSRPLFQSLELTLQPQAFCVVIGSNGSGKSTLMKLIAGLITPDAGEIWLDHNNLTNADRAHLVASVVQDVNQGTIAEMTLLENMALSFMGAKRAGLRAYKHYTAAALAQIRSLDLGLDHRLDQPLSQLSGGQRQMIATLMAVHMRPKVLLLDEHTSALDPKMQAVLMRYTNRSILETHLTAMMVTHKLDDAIAYGNRLIMLCNGQIVLDVSGAQKQALTVSELLTLFHHYEDQSLIEPQP